MYLCKIALSVLIDLLGILLQVINPDLQPGPDYMTIFVNNNGGITMEFDVGWGRFDASCDIEKVDLANNQNHDVAIWRANLGHDVYIQVHMRSLMVQCASALVFSHLKDQFSICASASI